MAYNCRFTMKIKGKRADVEEFIDAFIDAAYNPDSGISRKHKTGLTGWEGAPEVDGEIYGFCKDSVSQTLPLQKESERLHLLIEVFSENRVSGYQQQIVFDNGEETVFRMQELFCCKFNEFEFDAPTPEERFKQFLQNCRFAEDAYAMRDLDEEKCLYFGGIAHYGKFTI